jgi:kumamolisin
MMPGAKVIGPTDPQEVIEVSVKLRGKKELPDISGRPPTPLTRDEFARAYGASQQDIDAVVDTLSKLGLKEITADAGTRTVIFSGPVAAIQKAFGVKLFDYAFADGRYRGREGYLYLPRELAGIVQNIFGLDNRRVARPRS